jgi:hypothetical protein
MTRHAISAPHLSLDAFFKPSYRDPAREGVSFPTGFGMITRRQWRRQVTGIERANTCSPLPPSPSQMPWFRLRPHAPQILNPPYPLPTQTVKPRSRMNLRTAWVRVGGAIAPASRHHCLALGLIYSRGILRKRNALATTLFWIFFCNFHDD